MAERAATWCDQVIPYVPVRQWVLRTACHHPLAASMEGAVPSVQVPGKGSDEFHDMSPLPLATFHAGPHSPVAPERIDRTIARPVAATKGFDASA